MYAPQWFGTLMFDIESVELVDFKSYHGRHKFAFPRTPGLYYLTGKNLKRPRLGANGTGKTSFLDAIRWCFYGTSTRGLKAGDVVTWGKKACQVSVCTNVGGKRFEVRRTQAPNSLTIIRDKRMETVDQETLTKLLGLNERAFDYAVLLPQFGDSFFDLKPTDKLMMFSQIMDLDFWLDRSRKADKLTEEIQHSVIGVEMAIAANKGRIGALKEDIVDLKGKSDTYEEKVAADLAVIRADEKEAKKLKTTQHNAVILAKRDIAAAEGKLASAVEAMQELEVEWCEADDKFQLVTMDLRQAQADVQNLEREQSGYDKLDGSDCPTCGQFVTPMHVRTHKGRIQRVINSKTQRVTKLTAQLAKEQQSLEKLGLSHNKLKAITEELKLALTTAEQDCRDSEYELRRTNSVLDDIKTRITNVTTQTNPYKQMREHKKTQLVTIQRCIANQEDDLAKLIEKREASSFWVSGFKRVRLYVVEEALRGLELEVNNQLASLGLPDWRIEFDVERENKAGGITRGFVVLIFSPENDKPVRWEAWSGGETQRLRLAGDLGLANLILERSGLSGQIEFFDEPSEHMASEGLADLLDTLYERAQTLHKRIWLSDHQTTTFGEFAGVLTVTKDAKGSHLEFQEN